MRILTNEYLFVFGRYSWKLDENSFLVHLYMKVFQQNQKLFFFSYGKGNGSLVFHDNRITAIRFNKMVEIGHIDQM